VTDTFESLSTGELTAIATALRAGRLSAPLSQLAVAPYLGRAAATLTPILAKLTNEGLSAEHLAFFLELLAKERHSQGGGDRIELVSTGPEADGLPARDTRIVVRELFRQAARSVLVAGYAVYQGREVFRVLAERMDANPDLAVHMFLDVQRAYGDTSRSSEILRRFSERFRSQEWPGNRLPDVSYDTRSLDPDAHKRASLHAKCVVIDERTAFVSSANFTEAAQVRNIEVGALVHSEAFARQLAGHFLGLAAQHLLERVPGL
jgi:phosphatidylserine/phosphatidylglycerophosphate/cardiolipin synthase-like enzyme